MSQSSKFINLGVLTARGLVPGFVPTGSLLDEGMAGQIGRTDRHRPAFLAHAASSLACRARDGVHYFPSGCRRPASSQSTIDQDAIPTKVGVRRSTDSRICREVHILMGRYGIYQDSRVPFAPKFKMFFLGRFSILRMCEISEASREAGGVIVLSFSSPVIFSSCPSSDYDERFSSLN
jgi:hypothetical protein